jgi:hypothetical protein
MLSNQAKELIPEVALFIRAPGNPEPLTCCDSKILKRQDFKSLIGDDKLAELMPNENARLEIELKKRVFIIKHKKNGDCQNNALFKTIWPDQTVIIKIGEIELEFYVMKCNYS